MTRIRPVGSVLECDAEGFLVNPCAREKILPPWDGPVEALRRAYRRQLGEDLVGIYLRGSVPKGGAVEGISDVDSFAVVADGPSDFSPEWAEGAWLERRDEFPFCDGFEILVLSRSELLESPEMAWWRFALVSQCLCIEGEDLARLLPRARPVPDQAGRADVLSETLPAFREEMGALLGASPRDPDHDEAVLSLTRWFFKRLLRNGFLLVMERERVYTRDLYPCTERFSRHYPDQAGAMWTALEWTLGGPPGPAEALELGVSLGEWILAEAQRPSST